MMTIERASFPTPARERVYRHDLADNDLAHYQALTLKENGRSERLIGYAGYWLLGDEAHISIIAVDPAWRGRGLGELLLLNLLYLACGHAARLVTLEVRAGNSEAQALYQKYDFARVGERRHYYRDTGENALLMTLTLDDASKACIRLHQRRAALFQRLRSAPF